MDSNQHFLIGKSEAQTVVEHSQHIAIMISSEETKVFTSDFRISRWDFCETSNTIIGIEKFEENEVVFLFEDHQSKTDKLSFTKTKDGWMVKTLS